MEYLSSPPLIINQCMLSTELPKVAEAQVKDNIEEDFNNIFGNSSGKGEAENEVFPGEKQGKGQFEDAKKDHLLKP